MLGERKERDPYTEIVLVIGGGPSGLEWARRKSGGREQIVCIDQQDLSLSDPHFLYGDVSKLSSIVGKGSIKKIHADFLFNAIGKEIAKGKSTVKQVLATNQSLLLCALQQMWSALKVGGEIIVLDRDYIIEWLSSDPAEMLQINSFDLKITSLDINAEDWKRSHSLNKIVNDFKQPISCLKKIRLQKMDDYPVLMPPWYGRYIGND